MLAKRRGFYRDEKEIIRTPLLLPSFSSKGFPEVEEIISATSERIEGACLISAYDLYYENIHGPFSFAQSIFVDSGGYEASKDVELSDLGMTVHEAREWSQEKFNETVSGWENPIDTVIISYDHPLERVKTKEQIERADAMIPKKQNVFREILFKPEECLTGCEPEPDAATKVNVSAIEANIRELARFDAMGVTEKEVGLTVRERMINIAKIRLALQSVGLDDMPIHVFGSLDTVSTPLYFVAGADVFDGLTWLRFAYHDGMTVYRQNYSTLRFGIDMKMKHVDLKCCWDNYGYMKELEREMRSYLTNGFKSFSHHRDIISKAYETVREETGV